MWNQKKIIENGIKNKYPLCCIKAFCKDIIAWRDPYRLRKIDHSGFVPCQKHYEQYLAKKNCIEKLCKATLSEDLQQRKKQKQSIESSFKMGTLAYCFG